MIDVADMFRIKELVLELNKHRDSYYNESVSVISDSEYDKLFDELKKLEEETGFIMSNSPTQSVGYDVKSELTKVKHSHPMLSLDKTKSTDDLLKFAGDQDCILSMKLDGLTILLTYENGELVQAETRGNGEEGEIVTHNAKVFDNIPLYIDYDGKLEIEGEAIIMCDDFAKINDSIDNPDNKYKNSRNLVSGSVRQLDSSVASKRHIKFIAWKVPSNIDGFNFNNSFFYKLRYVASLGFDVVPLYTFSGDNDKEHINDMVESLKKKANDCGYPIDGLVMTYDNVSYGESLGSTGHHPKHSIAFKFYDEEVETVFKYIEWTMGKTGVLTPTAVFDPVEIDGTTVERASVHNVSILKSLNLMSGDAITVYKANQIIPQISENLDADKHDNGVNIPSECPICGHQTCVSKDNDSEVLICTNDNCKGKLLGKLTHFASKNAMNIDGLSEATIEKFIELGWLNSLVDIYNLDYHYDNMINLDGFGKKSVDKLMTAIETSKNTTLDRFIYALSIPLIGRSASKDISKYYNGDFEKFFDAHADGDYVLYEDNIDGFGSKMSSSINNYMLNDRSEDIVWRISQRLNFSVADNNVASANLSGFTFVITGSLEKFENRDSLKEHIENAGGKVVGSVSSKTSYLINNDVDSSSSKNKKAKELGVPIITEDELIKIMN